MTKITTDWTAGNTGPQAMVKLFAVHDWWLGAAARDGETTSHNSVARLSGLLTSAGQPALTCGEAWLTAGPKINLLNDPDALIVTALYGDDEEGTFTGPIEAFSDTAGTTPATFGGSIARLTDFSGNDQRFEQANAALRPKLGRRPIAGRRNELLATDSLATQSVTVTAAERTLSFTGTGTVTLSGVSTAGPLVGTGAEDRVTLTFTPTAGTLTLTVTGSVTLAQLEPGDTATAYQRVGDEDDITEAGVASPSYIRPDLSDDVLPTTFAAGGTFDIAVFGRRGSWIVRDVVIAPGGTLNIGPSTFTGAPTGTLLAALGRITGIAVRDHTIDPDELALLMKYQRQRGAKGLLVPGPELVTNGDFEDGATGWVETAGITFSGGQLSFNDVNQNRPRQTGVFVTGAPHLVSLDVDALSGGAVSVRSFAGTNFTTLSGNFTSPGVYDFIATPPSSGLTFALGAGAVGSFNSVSVRRLTPEEI